MNNALFVSFSCSHDLNNLPEGAEFVANWRVRNIGSESWLPTFRIDHIHATTGSVLMAGQASFELAQVANPSTVPPGAESTISLTMTARPPRHRLQFTDWQLQDGQGHFFGHILFLRAVTIDPPPAGGNFLESNSLFLADHTVPDGSHFVAGQPFDKQWLVRNTGERIWSTGYRLVFAGGDGDLAGVFSHPVPETRPSEEVIVSVPMVAPPQRNEPYVSYWRLHDDRNMPFGDRFWAKVFADAPAVTGTGLALYSQNDPRWADRPVGHGERTFSQYGCLVVCYAMMLNAFGESLSPIELNDRLLPLGGGMGFDGSDVFFIAPRALFGHVHLHGNFKPRQDSGSTFATFRPNLLAEVDTALGQGRVVLAEVDATPVSPYNPFAEQHWVVLVRRMGSDYQVYDPLRGEQLSLVTRYGRPTSPQSGETALVEAIKSVLIYSSDNVSPAGGPGTPLAGGQSHIEPTLSYTGPAWPFGRLLVGIHDRTDRHPQAADFSIAGNRFDTLKVQSGVTVAEVGGYQLREDLVVCRLYESFNNRVLTPDEFVNNVANDLAPLIQQGGVRFLELHNEPNLSHEGLAIEGLTGSWHNGAEFAQFFIAARNILRQRFGNDVKVGFPGLSPGPNAAYHFGPDSGFRLDDKVFLSQATAAVNAADFLCVHAYYANMSDVQNAAGLVRRYRQQFPSKLILVTEHSNPVREVPAVEKGRQARLFNDLCRNIPGVGATYFFTISGSGWDHQALRRDADGLSTGLIDGLF
jgi:hypothetical protein